jgi:hypothetical protein
MPKAILPSPNIVLFLLFFSCLIGNFIVVETHTDLQEWR